MPPFLFVIVFGVLGDVRGMSGVPGVGGGFFGDAGGEAGGTGVGYYVK